MSKNYQKVYLKEEFIDFVNPLIGEMNEVNYRAWDVINRYEQSYHNSLNSALNSDSTKHFVLDLKQGGLFLKAVREYYVITLEEVREEKLKKLLQ